MVPVSKVFRKKSKMFSKASRVSDKSPAEIRHSCFLQKYVQAIIFRCLVNTQLAFAHSSLFKQLVTGGICIH